MLKNSYYDGFANKLTTILLLYQKHNFQLTKSMSVVKKPFRSSVLVNKIFKVISRKTIPGIRFVVFPSWAMDGTVVVI